MGVRRQRARRSLGGGLLGAIALSACGTLPATSVEHKSDPPAVDSGAVQSLQRRIRERDTRIAELASQLDALKVIDQDTAKFQPATRDVDSYRVTIVAKPVTSTSSRLGDGTAPRPVNRNRLAHLLYHSAHASER